MLPSYFFITITLFYPKSNFSSLNCIKCKHSRKCSCVSSTFQSLLYFNAFTFFIKSCERYKICCTITPFLMKIICLIIFLVSLFSGNLSSLSEYFDLVCMSLNHYYTTLLYWQRKGLELNCRQIEFYAFLKCIFILFLCFARGLHSISEVFHTAVQVVQINTARSCSIILWIF